MTQMDSQTLLALIQARIDKCAGRAGTVLVADRRRALRYYRGDKFGNEIEGRSQVVSRDVAEAIDGMMPSLMRIFASGDEVVRFEPVGPEDDEAAHQATDYVNWIWNKQNDGFANFYVWFKDALLNRLGTIKIWWEDGEDRKRESYIGLTGAERAILATDPSVEIVEESAYSDPNGSMADPAPNASEAGGVPVEASQVYDVTLRRKRKTGRIIIRPVPPEEILVDAQAQSLDEAEFVAHRVRRTAGELVAQGYPRAKIAALQTGDGVEWGSEHFERNRPEGGQAADAHDDDIDPALRSLTVNECYLKVDYDGDGIAEYRKVTVAGDTILDNEETDFHPFAELSPILMPHKLIGQSVADQTMDLQLIKSTLWRQVLDNLYLANAPQLGAVEGEVNLDDLLTRRPGGVVRAKSPGAVFAIPTQPVGPEAYQMIEYVDATRERRTGVTRYNQGLDADTLNKTASGIAMIRDAGEARVELIARVFAETGVKRAFKRILQLVCKHQQRSQMLRLRNRWVAMDPRAWDDGMDVTVSVGLGTGNKDRMLTHLMQLLEVDREIIALQGGLSGPLVTADNLYSKLKRIAEAANLKSSDSYYTDPRSVPPQPPAPSPDRQALAQQAQMQAAQLALAGRQAQASAELARHKAEAELALRRADQTGRLALEREKAVAEFALEREKLALDAQIKSAAAKEA